MNNLMISHEYNSVYIIVIVTRFQVRFVLLTLASCMTNARLVGHYYDSRGFKDNQRILEKLLE
jgi:hypothetical protein